MKKIFAGVLIALGLCAAVSCGSRGSKAVESDVDSTEVVAADSLAAVDSVAVDTVAVAE